jgi:tetratricopeptide (TPR) repeat protein
MSRWTIPSIAVYLLIFLLSFRLLSDPDLGFHLKAGKWILENKAIPHHDISTYTVSTNEYIDLHWLFQVFVFQVYSATGYPGLSLLVTVLSLTLLCLLLLRNRMFKIPTFITCILLFFGYLIIEPRIMLRPEMLTFLYISVILIILDVYFYSRKNFLFFIPCIMLLWCNTQGLFVLGFILFLAYSISLTVKKKKLDRIFIFWMLLSIFTCLLNPYFFKGFTFPIELFTRFENENIFNQHIKEFSSIYHLKSFNTKEFLFLIFSTLTILLTIITWKRRKLHEFILLIIFLYLSFLAIRNIPLFIIIAFPVISSAWKEVHEKIRDHLKFKNGKVIRIGQYTIITLFTIITLGFTARIYTNDYYISNKSYNKTGMGIDTLQQPVMVTTFLIENNLNGRIINSLSFGGWLSWCIPQPVFIDARLEVIKEDLYHEVYDSWNGGLQRLIEKYHPDLMVYNYQVYYPWTEQLANNPEWRLIYIDGIAVVFAHQGYKTFMESPQTSSILSRLNLTQDLDVTKLRYVFNSGLLSNSGEWIDRFYKKYDYSANVLQNIGSFYYQTGDYYTAEVFLLYALQKSEGKNTSIYSALSEIYKETRNNPLLQAGKNNPEITREKIEDAVVYFNSGNKKYKEGNYMAAMADFTKSIELNPKYYKAYNNRAIIRAFALKQFTEAIHDFDTAIKLNPDYGDAYMGRGSVKFHMRDMEGACRDWQKSVATGNKQALKLIEQHCFGR